MEFLKVLFETTMIFFYILLYFVVGIGLFVAWVFLMDDHPILAIALMLVVSIVGISLCRYFGS